MLLIKRRTAVTDVEDEARFSRGPTIRCHGASDLLLRTTFNFSNTPIAFLMICLVMSLSL